MKRHILVTTLLITLILISSLFFYWSKFKSAVDTANKNAVDYPKIEEAFLAKPNIDDGIILIERHYFKENYGEALFYAKKCIHMGVNQTPFGYLVNFQMAVIYNKIGNTKLATSHLKTAIKLDSKEIILKSDWIKRENLSHLLIISHGSRAHVVAPS